MNRTGSKLGELPVRSAVPFQSPTSTIVTHNASRTQAYRATVGHGAVQEVAAKTETSFWSWLETFPREQPRICANDIGKLFYGRLPTILEMWPAHAEITHAIRDVGDAVFHGDTGG
ncbi:hypothetical protein AKJ29_05830 [Aliiroseovarius crassostreae]|uniref:Uncharacterized protein n=1 Tax=Aliiroseovarius crassostreae TaxID=154981 RepID=A0A0P7I644_9RHOB|nr:hypothetical protein AKJ29_05830 [Aliiroseovarius crassostreae]